MLLVMRCLHPVGMLLTLFYSFALGVVAVAHLWSKHATKLQDWKAVTAIQTAAFLLLLVVYLVMMWGPSCRRKGGDSASGGGSNSASDSVRSAQKGATQKLTAAAAAIEEEECRSLRAYRLDRAFYAFYYGSVAFVSVFNLAFFVFLYAECDQGTYMSVINSPLNSNLTFDYPRTILVVSLCLQLLTSLTAALSAMPVILYSLACRSPSPGVVT
jgi:hypothetical protein